MGASNVSQDRTLDTIATPLPVPASLLAVDEHRRHYGTGWQAGRGKHKTSGASSSAHSRAGASGSRAHSALSAMFMRAPGNQRASSGLVAACSILCRHALSGPPHGQCSKPHKNAVHHAALWIRDCCLVAMTVHSLLPSPKALACQAGCPTPPADLFAVNRSPPGQEGHSMQHDARDVLVGVEERALHLLGGWWKRMRRRCSTGGQKSSGWLQDRRCSSGRSACASPVLPCRHSRGPCAPTLSVIGSSPCSYVPLDVNLHAACCTLYTQGMGERSAPGTPA